LSAQKTSITLDADLWRQVRADAVLRGTTAREIVERQLKDYLSKRETA
jgi:hypothetical protein